MGLKPSSAEPRGQQAEPLSGKALLFQHAGGSFTYIRGACSGSEELPERVFSKNNLCGVILRPQGREWQPNPAVF